MTFSNADKCEDGRQPDLRTGCSPSCCCWVRLSRLARTIALRTRAACSTASPAPLRLRNIKIDTNCTLRNYPGGMSTNFAFDNNDPTSYLVIFDNVLHTGQMACNAVAEHTPSGSPTDRRPRIHEGCQNLFDPRREDRQAEPGRARPRPRSACRSPTGSIFRSCSPRSRSRARSSTTAARSTTCTASLSRTISTRRARCSPT